MNTSWLPWRRERDEQGRRRKGTWSQSYSGFAYWPVDPRADEIHYDDICVGLSRAYRYRGLTVDAYSVAEHSVIVSLFAEREAKNRNLRRMFGVENLPSGKPLDVARYALLHDAQEAFIGDIARPLKRQRVMRGYRKIESKWEDAIIEHFNLHVTDDIRALVKEIDDRIVLDEVEALFLDPDMWRRAHRYPNLEPLGADIAALPWEQAMEVFNARFEQLFPEYVKEVM